MIWFVLTFLGGAVFAVAGVLFAISDAGRARIIGLQLLDAADAKLDAEADS